MDAFNERLREMLLQMKAEAEAQRAGLDDIEQEARRRRSARDNALRKWMLSDNLSNEDKRTLDEVEAMGF